ncbi:hypothetical protein GEMRC1_006578 [Eukaryota sp. GEM-RC1]
MDPEPKLKYQRLGESISLVFEEDAATSLGTHDKFLALGTRSGAVYITDIVGNAIDPSGQTSISPDELPPPFIQHQGAVNAVVVSSSGDFVGSCGDDGKVHIRSVHSSESLTFSYRGALKSLALDPSFGSGTNRNFFVGGLAGQLIFNSRGFFRSKDTVLHSGQGTIHSISWNNDFVAWTNDVGLKIHDLSSNQRIFHSDRPQGPPPDACPSCLCWIDNRLVVSWGRCLQVFDVSIGHTFEGVRTVSQHSHIVYDFFICGVLPYSDPDDSNLLSLLAFFEQGEPPELIISSLDSNQEFANDALEVVGYEHYVPNDYNLISSLEIEESFADQSCFVVSPKDIIIGRPRDIDDHVRWLADHGNFEDALPLALEHSSMLRTLSPCYIAGLFALSKAGKETGKEL